MDKRIGAQYYTIRDFCQTLDDFEKSCEKVSKIGYKTVQLSAIGDFDPNDIKTILDKNNLKAVCTHRPADNYLNNIEKEIEFHKIIGCDVAGLGAMPYGEATSGSVKRFIEEFSPVAERLGSEGLTFAYHNHCWEFMKEDGRFIMDMMLGGFKSENLKLILDVYWLAYAGINPAKFIRAYGDRLACIHFKDLKIDWHKQKFAEIGYGNLDWDEIIAACDDSEAKYALVEQDVCDDNPFVCLERSYKFLSQKGFE